MAIREPGPDESSFGGAGAAGGLLGGGSTIDKSLTTFSTSITKLDTVINDFTQVQKNVAGGQSGQVGNEGTTGSHVPLFPRPNAAVFGGSQPTATTPTITPPAFNQASAGQPTPMGGPNGGTPSASAGQTPATLNQQAANMSPETNAQGQPINSTGATLGSPTSPANPMGGGANGGSGGPGNAEGFGYGNPSTPAAKPQGWGKQVASALGGPVKAISSLGLQTMAPHTALSTLDFMSLLGKPKGVSSQQFMNQVNMFAGGGNRKGNNKWALGFNASDQFAATDVLQQVSGNPLPYKTARGRAAIGGMAAFGEANNNMSMTAAAQASGEIYNGQTARKMQMMGYVPSINGADQPNSMANIVQGMMARNFGGRGSVSQKQLNLNMSTGGNGQMYNNLSRMLGTSTANSMAPVIKMYNDLLGGAGGQQKLSTNAAQQLVNAASRNTTQGKDAWKKLQKYDVNVSQSDLAQQKLKAGQTASDVTDTQQGFVKGVQAATTALNSTKAKAGALMDKLHLNGPVGKVLGVGGGLGGNVVSKGVGLASKGFSVATNLLGIGAASGAEVAAYAKTFATGLNHPYVNDGSSPTSGWDCVGFADYVYDHFGVDIPGFTPGQDHTSLYCANMWDNAALKSSPQVAGAMVFEAGSDGTQAAPGHVGISMGGPGSQMVAAADSERGTVPETPSQVSGYRVPKSGAWTGGGGGNGSSGTTTGGAGFSAGGMSAGLGTGDTATMGGSSELQDVGSAVTGGISAGSGYTGEPPPVPSTSGSGSSGGSGSSASGYTSGSNAANLVSIGKYLMANGYDKYGAAGVAGTIAGESGGDPESVGSGGNGLIGWTPPKAGIVTGNATKDFQTQLPLIISYANANSAEAESRGGQSLADLKSASSLQQALTDWSAFEGPADPGSDERLAAAQTVYNALAGGGHIRVPKPGGGPDPNEGKGYIVGTSPYVKKKLQSASVNVLTQVKKTAQPMTRMADEGGTTGKNAITRSPQAPFTIAATERIVPSTLNAMFSGGGSSQGKTSITLKQGAIQVTVPTGMTNTQQAGKYIASCIVEALQKQGM